MSSYDLPDGHRWIEDWPAFSVLLGGSFEDALEGRFYHRGVRAAPAGVGANPDLALLGWKPPAWLEGLYSIHGGLGPWRGTRDRWGPGAILPWEEVVPLTAKVRFGEENVLFDPADCVLLAPDGKGGGLVLTARNKPELRWMNGALHTLSTAIPREDGLARAVALWILE